ncbi:MFS general substrate transporter [Polyplosphaeria fusca]|uniref:MFS general substrate transporter n=1 Tax=Polyplosphaeria fusca TaxID=682080 RepID=A0A9P4QIB9_9PLEO|nr:MFS general substrate transporter [Polyplosphaeria fusca]
MIKPDSTDSQPPNADQHTETTPLLPSPDASSTKKEHRWGKSVLYRALAVAFCVSLTFGITQIPMLYVFRQMTCDAFYTTHPSPQDSAAWDRCQVRRIEADTARAVALLAASTTVFGILNLLVTGWSIKRWGVKPALLIQVFWPAIRLLVQNIGVATGGEKGIVIMQASQIITIVGGPNGYVLALNNFVTDVATHEERTGALGRLQGCMMVGAALGFLIGGLIGGAWGVEMPFRLTLVLFVLCTVCIALALPSIPRGERPDDKEVQKGGLKRFLGPLRIFAPQKWVRPDGSMRKHYGALNLGIGVFLGILATGYIPTLLQMYSTNDFGFGTEANGWLIFIYSSLRGLFLSLVFPRIISAGRKWTAKREERDGKKEERERLKTADVPHMDDLPTEANGIEGLEPMENDGEPVNPPQRTDEKETFDFDLYYARFSLLLDGILTGLATFVFRGWHLYLVAVLLPFAAGTGAASKGVILQMLPGSERVDALSGITLVENFARLSTTGVFGLVFAALAEAGKSWLVFCCNAGVAMVGFTALLMVRFPEKGSRRSSD